MEIYLDRVCEQCVHTGFFAAGVPSGQLLAKSLLHK